MLHTVLLKIVTASYFHRHYTNKDMILLQAFSVKTKSLVYVLMIVLAK